MDREKIEFHIRGLLEAIGEDPEREGLIETPSRVAGMIEEVLEGSQYTNHEIGGVCAFGVTRDDVRIYCDKSMQRFDTVYPACGSSNSCAEFTPDELFRVSRALEWIDVSKLPGE